MKKKILLPFFVTAFAVTTAFGAVSTPQVALAEEPNIVETTEDFSESDYVGMVLTHEAQEGNVKDILTIVLGENNIAKITLEHIEGENKTVNTAEFAYLVVAKNTVRLFSGYEDEYADLVFDENGVILGKIYHKPTAPVPPIEPDTPKEDKIEEIKDFLIGLWNNQVLPILAGITGGNLLIFIIRFALDYAKKKKMSKREQAVEKELSQSSELLAKQAEIYADIEKLSNLIVEHVKVTEEELHAMNNLVVDNNKKVENVENIKNVLIVLSEIITKIALVDNDVCSAGVGVDVDELNKLIKELANGKAKIK